MFDRESKRTGWFSRKHQTQGAYLKSKRLRLEKEEDQFDAIQEMADARKERSDEEQIKLLDKRLGEGIGATKERARLNKRIANKKQG